MNFIVELLNSIGNLLLTLINYLIDYFQMLISFITSIPQYINFFTVSLEAFPGFVLPFAVFGVYLTITLFLTGRSKS